MRTASLDQVGGSDVNAMLLGQTLAFATPGKNSVVGVYAGAGADWRVHSDVSFFAAGEHTEMSDASKTVSGKAGVRVRF